jgi:uncharacterized protein
MKSCLNTECKRLLRGDIKFCPHCGQAQVIDKNLSENNVNSASEQVLQTTMAEESSTIENRENEKTLGKASYSTEITMLILVGVIILVYFISQKEEIFGNSKPSFDCSKAKHKTELTICNEPSLAKLDSKNAELYKNAEKINPTQAKQQLNNSVKNRYKCQGDYDCIKSNLQQSIGSYNSLISSNQNNSYPKPINHIEQSASATPSSPVSSQATCDAKILSRHNRSGQDKYGNSYISKVEELRSFTHIATPGWKYGNNKALDYVVWIENYENGSPKPGLTIKYICITDLSGQFLGLDRNFD